MYDSNVIGEDTVKYFVDIINDEKKNIGDLAHSMVDISEINYLVQNMKCIWDTFSGVEKINGLQCELNEIDSNRIVSLVQEIDSITVSYNKKHIHEKM